MRRQAEINVVQRVRQEDYVETWRSGGVLDPSWAPSDPAERAVWDRLPVGQYAAITYEQAVEVPGQTAKQSRMALLSLVMARKARAWAEAPGIMLVARGPFRACDRCGAYCAPGPCRSCRFDPAARAA